MIADLTAESEPDGFEAAFERGTASAADRDVVLHRGTAIQQGRRRGHSPVKVAAAAEQSGRRSAPDATVTDR